MRTITFIPLAALGALALTGCASPTMLEPTRAVAKRDAAACSKVADSAVNEPNRRNNQTAAAIGTTIGAGLIGLVVISAAQSADDKAVENKATADCLSRRGYKMVPKKEKTKE